MVRIFLARSTVRALRWKSSPSRNTRRRIVISPHCFFFSFLSAGKPLSVAICEGGNKTISCKTGAKLVILEAMYGRLNSKTCNSSSIHSTNCSAAKSLAIVQSTCHGEASCVLHASNSVFGDPCRLTGKYLLVKYKCLEY